MTKNKRILIVVTSHASIDGDHPTGLWFEEFAAPYALFRKQGYAVTVTSVKGPEQSRRLAATPDNEAAKRALADTRRLSSELSATAEDAGFFPRGHGTLFDLPNNPEEMRSHHFAI